MAVEDAPSYADLQREVEQLRRELAEAREREAAASAREGRTRAELTEALERQTATAEVLRTIASAPSDLQAVLDGLLTSAARLCDADVGIIWRVEGPVLRSAARYRFPEDAMGMERPLDRTTNVGSPGTELEFAL